MTSVYLFSLVFCSSSQTDYSGFSRNKSHQCGSCCCCCLLLSSYSFNAHFTSRCRQWGGGWNQMQTGRCVFVFVFVSACVFKNRVHVDKRKRTIIIGDVEAESTNSGSKEFSSSTSRQEEDRTAAASGGMSTCILYIHQKCFHHFFQFDWRSVDPLSVTLK